MKKRSLYRKVYLLLNLFMDLVKEKDVAVFSRIEAVNLILETLQRLTGMRLSLVARVDSDSWTACAVLDRAEFGLNPGDRLELSTTY